MILRWNRRPFIKVLFLLPECYVPYQEEPSYYEVTLLIQNCGQVSDFREFPYQRIFREQGELALHQETMKIVREYSPQLIVYVATWDSACLRAHTLQAINHLSIPIYAHLCDTYFIYKRAVEFDLISYCQYLGIGDSVSFYQRYRSLVGAGSLKGVLFTPGHNVFTDIIKKTEVEKIYDVTLLGSLEGMRIKLFEGLKEKLSPLGIKLEKFGGLVNQTREFPAPDQLQVNDDWLSWPDYARIINQSKICLTSQTRKERTQVKGKIYDFLACGTLGLCDANVETLKAIPADCVVFYDSDEDCYEKIVYYLQHQEEREKIAKRGYDWYHQHHNYKKFWGDFLQTLRNPALPVEAHPLLEKSINREQDFLLKRLMAICSPQFLKKIVITCNILNRLSTLPGFAYFFIKGLLYVPHKIMGPNFYLFIKRTRFFSFCRQKILQLT